MESFLSGGSLCCVERDGDVTARAPPPAADTGGEQETSDELLTTDDAIAPVTGMRMSRNEARFVPAFSLLHRLATQSDETTELLGAAHRVWDITGMVQSTSPARVT
jgi:hypothetical protein